MIHWLLDHFIWVAFSLVLIIVGLKFAIAAVLKRLMDESAAAEREATESTDPADRHR